MTDWTKDPTDRAFRDLRLATTAVALAVGAVLLVVEAVRDPVGAAWLLAAAAFSASMSFAGLALSGYGRRQARRLHVDGARVTIGFRRTAAVGMAVGSLTGTALFAWGTVAFAGEPGTLLTGACAISLALASVWTVPIALRDCRLVLTPDGIELRGWFEEGSVAWEDLRTPVRVEAHATRRLLRLHALPGATSFRRRLLEPVLPWGHGHRTLTLHADCLDEPVRLAAALDLVAEAPAAARAHHLAHRVAPLLLREWPHRP